MTYAYQLFQEGEMVAMVEADNDEDAKREIEHYAMMYLQDGPVEIKPLTEGK